MPWIPNVALLEDAPATVAPLDDYRVVLEGSTITAYDMDGDVAFSGADFGAVMTGCMTALASSAGNPVGSIGIGVGTFPYTTNALIPRVAPSGTVAQALDPGWLRIHGVGGGTRIKNMFSSGGATASAFLFDRAENYDSFGNIIIEDMLWDANDIVGYYAFFGDYDGGATARSRVNIGGIRMRRIRAINAPTCDVSQGHVGLAWIGSYHSTSAQAISNFIRDIQVEDCEMIDNGNYGIVIGGDAGAGADANILIDDIHLTRCNHTMFYALVDGDQAADTGTLTVMSDPNMDDYGLFDPTAPFPTASKVNVFDSTGSFVTLTYTGKTATTLTGVTGGTGGRTLYDGGVVGLPVSDNYIIGTKGHVNLLRITDCVGGYSGDNSLEIDNAMDVIVRGYSTENNANYCIYLNNSAVSRFTGLRQRLEFDSPDLRKTIGSLGQSALFKLGTANASWPFREIILNDPKATITADRFFNNIGGLVAPDITGSYYEKFTINNPQFYWSTGGVASLSATSAPVMVWFYSLVSGAISTLRGGRLHFAGATPTLNGNLLRTIGVGVGGTDAFADLDFSFRNDPGSSTSTTTKGAVVFGFNSTTTSPRGRVHVVCDAYTNDTTAGLVCLTTAVTLDANHRLVVSADGGALPSGGVILFSGTAGNYAYVKLRDVTYQNSDVRPVPSAFTGLVTATGKQIGLAYPVMAVFTQGSGAAITKIEYSTNAGTTYTTVLEQASGALPAGMDLVLGPLDGDALIKPTFTTTQPTITLVPA